MNELFENQELSHKIKEELVTIKELADIKNVSESTIKRSIKRVLPYKLKNGITTLLNQVEVTNILHDIDKSRQLVNPAQVKTDLDKELIIRQAMIFQNEKIESLTLENKKLKSKLIEAKPKIESFDKIMSSENLLTMNDVAKTLKIGLKKLFAYLRREKILMSNNIHYQQYDRYFKTITRPIKVGKKIEMKTTTRVTSKGLEYIRKKIKDKKI